MRMAAATALIGLVAGAAALAVPAEPQAAQPKGCLHGPGESAAEAGRRKAAVEFVRRINTAQAQAMAAAGQYQPLASLNLPATPDGFLLQFGESASGYVFGLKDTYDPCGFAYFSDQDGLIYTAQPIQ